VVEWRCVPEVNGDLLYRIKIHSGTSLEFLDFSFA
jgi:hypothetical protein